MKRDFAISICLVAYPKSLQLFGIMLSPDRLPLGARAPMLIWHWAIADAPVMLRSALTLSWGPRNKHRFIDSAILVSGVVTGSRLGLRRSTLTAVHVAATEE
jgi:hypothetical protein